LLEQGTGVLSFKLIVVDDTLALDVPQAYDPLKNALLATIDAEEADLLSFTITAASLSRRRLGAADQDGTARRKLADAPYDVICDLNTSSVDIVAAASAVAAQYTTELATASPVFAAQEFEVESIEVAVPMTPSTTMLSTVPSTSSAPTTANRAATSQLMSTAPTTTTTTAPDTSIFGQLVTFFGSEFMAVLVLALSSLGLILVISVIAIAATAARTSPLLQHYIDKYGRLPPSNLDSRRAEKPVSRAATVEAQEIEMVSKQQVVPSAQDEAERGDGDGDGDRDRDGDGDGSGEPSNEQAQL